MSKRKITKFDGLKFKPFDRYGKTIPGMSWHKISYDDKTNFGTYVSKLEPGTKTVPHIHTYGCCCCCIRLNNLMER